MSSLQLEIHPRAIAEARRARRWYARRSQAVADRFMAELDGAVERIMTGPQQWPEYLHGTRAFRLKRFRYLVVYLESAETLQMVAVAHGSQRPGYWKGRLS